MTEKMDVQVMHFLKTSLNEAEFSLRTKCSQTTTHLLIAIRRQGHKDYERIYIINRSSLPVLNLYGHLEYKTHEIVICGLRQDRETELQRQTKDLSLYSVIGVSTYSMRESLDEKQDVTVDLTAAHERLMEEIESKEYDEFPIEVIETFPMDYSLKVTTPSKSMSMGRMYIVSDMKHGSEHVMVCHRPASLVPLLPIHQSRTEYKVKVMSLTDSEKYVLSQHHLSTRTTEELTDADNYDFTSHSCSAISKTVTIKTDNSMRDLYELMEKAKSYCKAKKRKPAWYKITQFYRNKPEDYINNILLNKGGVMEKYNKDNNGDEFSPINHKIDGLFFSASLVKKTKAPPKFSLFGNTRIFVPAEQFISPDMCMYFADFYCHYKIHYVTVVMTKIGSKEDDFCRHRLPQLNLEDNRFFIVKLDPTTDKKVYKMASIKGFHVEFLYTENIDIPELQAEIVKTRGRGKSKADGIPKKKGCPICNLEPESQMTIPGFGALKLL